MKSKLLAATAIGAMVFAFSSASAQEGEYTEVDCSPGYWKNHTEVWKEACDAGDFDCGLVKYLIFYPPGPQAGVYRNQGADILNWWASVNDVEANCDD